MLSAEVSQLLGPVQQFLQCDTPAEWLHMAAKPEHLAMLLQDHMICELKAAQSAMYLIRRYAALVEASASNPTAWAI